MTSVSDVCCIQERKLIQKFPAMSVLDRIKEHPQPALEDEALQQLRSLWEFLTQSPENPPLESPPSESSERIVEICNQAFKPTQDFAADIAREICPDGFLQRFSVKKGLAALMKAREEAYVVLETKSCSSSSAQLRLVKDAVAAQGGKGGDGDEGSFISTVLMLAYNTPGR
jgi:hypothetical protein